MIAAKVYGKGYDEEWMLIGVYGDPTRVENPVIWSELESHVLQYDGAVCLIGDFNAIVSVSEKWGGQEQLSCPNRAFRTWIHQAGLIDLSHSGPAYTWSNKQTGPDNVSERLDRALGNLAWTMKNPNALVFHLPRFQSDHLPILLRTKPSKKRNKPGFKCENWWGLRDCRILSPTVHTFDLAIDCCCRMRRVDLDFCVLAQSLREGCGPNTIMFGSLMKGLCALDQIDVAEKVLAKMPFMGCAPNMIIYNTLIDGLCKNVDVIAAQKIFKEMHVHGVVADLYTTIVLLMVFTEIVTFL